MPPPAPAEPQPSITSEQMKPHERAEHAALFAKSPDEYEFFVGRPFDDAGQQELADARIWLHAPGFSVSDGDPKTQKVGHG
jgi:hypothetical protein